MNTPQDYLQHAYRNTTHIVLVTEKQVIPFPQDMFCNGGRDFNSEETMRVACQKALRALDRPSSVLGSYTGFAVYNTRGMSSYMYTVYAIVNNKAVEIGYVHEISEIATLVEEHHASKFQGTEDELAERLDTELSRHDWYAHMAEGSAWASADAHMKETVMPLLAALPEDRGLTIWQKHAPEGYTRNPYT